MKLPNDETPVADMNGGDGGGGGYLSDEYDQLEMIPAPIRDGDFSEYLWMENEEEFNTQVLRELEEEELMEQCIVAMLDDEESSSNSNNDAASTNNNTRSTPAATTSRTANSTMNGLSESVDNMSISSSGPRVQGAASANTPSTTNNNPSRQPSRFSAQNRLSRISATHVSNESGNDAEEKSNLNPDAKEFVPLARNPTEMRTTAATAESEPDKESAASS